MRVRKLNRALSLVPRSRWQQEASIVKGMTWQLLPVNERR